MACPPPHPPQHRPAYCQRVEGPAPGHVIVALASLRCSNSLLFKLPAQQLRKPPVDRGIHNHPREFQLGAARGERPTFCSFLAIHQQ
eukprot:8288525-Pyramimonas_sp.AAC.1